MTIKKLAIFCGSNVGNRPEYVEVAKQLSTLLAEANITLVYGGAKVGLMGVLADQILKLGGSALGVLPESLIKREVAHQHLTELHIVPSMHERKLLINELADGFIMLPGGVGSLDEFFEVMTLAKIGEHRKPFGILNIANYFDSLINFVTHSVNEGFLEREYCDMMMVEEQPTLLLQRLQDYQPPAEIKWLNDIRNRMNTLVAEKA